jgi:hypothetical protein
LKKILVNLLKFGVSAGILTYLVIDAQRNQTFAKLASQPKHWSLLLLAFVICLAAVALTHVRWYFLVRALNLPFTLRDAFRLGFLGYLMNFVSLGSVGGDLFKAVFIAHEQPGKRAEAVATVFIDRVVGLYGLFVVATIAILSTGLLSTPVEQIRIISLGTLASTLVGALGILALLIPGVTNGRFTKLLGDLPRVGPLFERLIGAIRMYRQRMGVLILAGVMSMFVHSMITVGIYLVARGLPGNAPSLGEHFLIVPLSMVAGALPLPLNGLGATEYVIEFLYMHVKTTLPVREGYGFIVSLAYRIITVVIAMVGVVVYLSSRKEMSAVIHEAEHEADESVAGAAV